ncbi:hypothetical protein BJX99DRAFT_261763 [Aspergillus californicus]
MRIDLSSDSSSGDELALNPAGNQRSSGPKKRQMTDPVYVPKEDEPDSPGKKRVSSAPTTQTSKRKHELGAIKADTSEPDEDLSPVSKKPRPVICTVSPKLTLLNSPMDGPETPRLPEFSLDSASETSSVSSVRTFPYPTTHKGRKRSAIQEDSNYVEENTDEEDERLERSYTIQGHERSHVLFDFDRERDRRLAGAINIPKNLYTNQEESLFLQLAMRGFEPLAPKHWQFDFPTLPDSLFPESGKKKADPIIKINRSTTFHATKSLGHLFSLSGRVRDCNIVAKRPEFLIKQTIKKYIRWALYDVNLDIGPGSVPIHVLHAQKKNESILDALERLNKHLRRLALRHQEALAGLPESNPTSTAKSVNDILLIGFIICGPVVAIMAFDINLLQEEDEKTDGKFISQFDLSERGQDVWNSLSLAIVIMHIRNTMVRLSEQGYGGFAVPSKTAMSNEDL